MKLISWNVNGIRAVLKKGFLDFIYDELPHILCLQETKAQPSQVNLEMDYYPFKYWNSAVKKGYSGTAVFSRKKPLNVIYGMSMEEHNSEGRLITLEFEKFFLVNVYTPNSQRGLERLNYRKQWDDNFREFLKDLDVKKPVVVCGDLNVAHEEIDIKNAKSNMTTETRPGNAGFTNIEREGFSKHLKEGFIDTFRFLHPKKEAYTWWSYMFNARQKNIGWRIDYFLISKKLKNNLKDAFILPEIKGSDHCPIGIILEV